MQRAGSGLVPRTGSGIARAGSVRLVTAGSGRVVEKVIVNKNVSWLNYPGVWAAYLATVLLLWLGCSAIVADAGLAWTYVHLIHGVITYYVLHWVKGSANQFQYDQGKYDHLTIWEQVDNQTYGTLSRKVFTIVPVILFLLASHGTELTKQPVGLNLVVATVLIFAKIPQMHKVRIFGINK